MKDASTGFHATLRELSIEGAGDLDEVLGVATAIQEARQSEEPRAEVSATTLYLATMVVNEGLRSALPKELEAWLPMGVFDLRSRASRGQDPPVSNRVRTALAGHHAEFPDTPLDSQMLAYALLGNPGKPLTEMFAGVDIGAVRKAILGGDASPGTTAKSKPSNKKAATKAARKQAPTGSETQPEREAAAVTDHSGDEASGVTTRPVPQFDAEGLDGRDLLDITDDVNAFANLMASHGLEPPMSIGIFGDWGSGKSFFMRKLRDRIQFLATAAGDRKAPKTSAFHHRIAQIEFNAWHYVEANLWASIVEHIFRNLRLDPSEGEAAVEKRRAALLGELDSDIAARLDAEGKVEAAARELTAAQVRVETERARLAASGDEAARLSAKDVWESVKFDPATRDAFARAMKGLGIEAALGSNAELRATVADLRGVSGRVRILWTSILTGPQAASRLAWLAVVLVAVPFVGLLAPLLVGWVVESEWARSLSSVLSQAAVLLGGVAAWLAKAAGTAKGAIAAIESAVTEFDTQVAADEQQRRGLEALDRTLATTRRDYEAALKSFASAEISVKQTTDHLADLRASRRLARFIDERVASDDYRKQLGLLAMVRGDFETLSRLMMVQRREATAVAPAATPGPAPLAVDDPNRIDRIILYIDDLDRCPARRVVEVLQAIHLLLAFPLFVVVVGVDARWVFQALRKGHPDLWQRDERSADDDSKGPPAAPRYDEDDEGGEGGATPRDYLEKIFQVPFWLRPMSATATGDLLAGLVEEKEKAKPVAAPDTVGPPGTAQATPVVAGGNLPAVAGATADVTGPEATATSPRVGSGGQPEPPKDPAPDDATMNPPGLELSEAERKFMRELAPILSRSPRSIKRFVNVYRLIRAGLNPVKQLPGFVGTAAVPGWYRETQLLLAIVNGMPELSVRVFETLRTGKRRGQGKMEFGTVNAESHLLDPGADGLTPVGVRQRLLLQAQLRSWATGAAGLEFDLSKLNTAAEQVSRYTFEVGGSAIAGSWPPPEAEGASKA